MIATKSLTLFGRGRMISVYINKVRSVSSQELSCEEVKIPMPWGHIAGKWWGPKNVQPVLVGHGWQDNCGSFDRLIPLLPKELSYFAIDYQGHGLSSQLPPGMHYYPMEAVLLTRRLMQYFGWTKISLLGHSLGATSSFVYTMLYPNTVDFLVCIDNLQPIRPPIDKAFRYITKNINEFLKYDALNNSNEEPPSYFEEELSPKLHESSRGSIALESCHYILKRNIARSEKYPNKFYFKRDPRLKAGEISYWGTEDVERCAANITCPVLVCSMSLTPYFDREAYYNKICDIINEKNGGRVEYHLVEGSHHTHLNAPDELAGIISNFINKYNIEAKNEGGFKMEIKASA